MVVPDYAHYLTGWRLWSLPQGHEPVRLMPIGVRDPDGWKPREIKRASCEWLVRPHPGYARPPVGLVPHACPSCGHVWHRSPELTCQCGLWAFKTQADLEGSGRDELVAGEVALWGKVIEHENGWRAECAYPLRLWTAPENVARLTPFGVPVAAFGTPDAPVLFDAELARLKALQAMLNGIHSQFAASMPPPEPPEAPRSRFARLMERFRG